MDWGCMDWGWLDCWVFGLVGGLVGGVIAGWMDVDRTIVLCKTCMPFVHAD